MAVAVVTIAAGGLPVVDVTATKPALGLPVTEAASGIAVTKVSLAVGGLPVTFVLAGNEWPASGGGDTDPYWTSVKLLLAFNGANNATSGPGFIDDSSAAHTTASLFTGAKISTTQSVFGGSSFFTSSGGTLTYADSADWAFSNQPFTVEFRMYPAAIGFFFLIGQWATAAPGLGWIIYQDNTTLKVNFSTDGTNSFTDLVGGTIAANNWYAVCVDFDGTKYRLYLNGVMVGSSTTVRTLVNSTTVLSIGGGNGAQYPYNGYIDELRLTNGVARYASDAGYTVATSAFPRGG